jgi:hypothetical protein
LFALAGNLILLQGVERPLVPFLRLVCAPDCSLLLEEELNRQFDGES